jgi:UDP-2,4-diacetamido-2,4,6-trideoxy-beta-L-altropyranose hydrolase
MSTAVFRTDASTRIGTGHVMRCLTLADALRDAATPCRFICREHPGNLIDLIRRRGHAVHVLPASAERANASSRYAGWLGSSWEDDAADCVAALDSEPAACLVVDHYALDARWEARLRAHCGRLFVIDDLADREHDCDLLLDQNLGRDAGDYRRLVPPRCQVLAGTSYALLRPEFAALRTASLQRRRSTGMRQLLIALGGVDKDNVTGQLLVAMKDCELPAGSRIVVAMGALAPWVAEVRDAAARLPHAAEVLVGTEQMAELMAASDLAIGAAGTMAWERCCLGLPTLTLVIADNQQAGARALAAAGASLPLDLPVTPASLAAVMARALEPQTLRAMQDAAARVTDGGGVERVVAHLRRLDGRL